VVTSLGNSVRKPWLLVGLAAVLAVVAPGCEPAGGYRGEVSGTVTYNGQKLNSGQITFKNDKGIESSGSIQPDGSYKIPDAPIGPVKIGVRTMNFAGMAGRPGMQPGGNIPKETKPPEGMAPTGGAPAMPPGGKPVMVPEKFADPESSGLTYTVTKGTQEHSIDIPGGR
jgi:hypothetical protein